MHRGLAETITAFTRGKERSRRPEDRALAQDYLAALAPLLARAMLGENIVRDLAQIERLFGHTWIVDPEPFEEAFARWRSFKEEYERWAVAGMTVNERLEALSLLEPFEAACASGDQAMARTLLARAHLNEPAIDEILKTRG